MSQACGLTEKGFKAKDFQAIKDDLEAGLQREVDSTLHFGAGSVAGILTAIVSNQTRQVWEVAYGLYHSLQPNTATGNALDALCSLTGTFRRIAAYSRAKAMLTLDAGTTLPEGSRIQTIGGYFFKITAEVRNSATMRNDIEADLIAEQHGPISAHAQTVAKIMTPVTGWSRAVIKHTYKLGRLDETDDELRLRRIIELKATGSSTCDAIRSRLLQLDQVEAVHIKEGVRNFEVIIKDGQDDEIARTIWQCKPLGIETAGNVVCTITDSIGQSRTIRFSRPEVINFSLNVELKVRQLLTQNEIDAIKNALVDFSTKHFKLGTEVYPSRFYGIAINHPQILDVTSLRLQERSPGRYPIAEISPHQIATLSFSNIDIKQTAEVAE